MRCLSISNFFLQWANLICSSLPIFFFLNKPMEEIQGSIFKYRVPPLRPTYTCERTTTFAKAYGIKVRCHWELFGKHVRNLGSLCFNRPTPARSPAHQKTEKKACMESRLFAVQMNSEEWTVHSSSPITPWKQKPSLHSTPLHSLPRTRKKKGGPCTPCRDFSLVACKFYS